MKEIQLRNFLYRCACGYELKVFLDCGMPQETYKCRNCGGAVQRKEA